MKKTIKWAGIGIVAIIILIAVAGMYKFNYLSGQKGYDVDGNKTTSTVHSPYVGQEKRDIKALSQSDIQGLLAGAGTPFGGMAKPAELNGYPGLRHVLDAFKAGELDLTDVQREKIEALYEDMRSEAIELGEQIIDTEKEIDDAFINETITENLLQEKVKESAKLYGQLRIVHLKYHLQIMDILSEEQVEKYNYLRGYTKEGDPCNNIPEGHNAEMWKLHHNCE